MSGLNPIPPNSGTNPEKAKPDAKKLPPRKLSDFSITNIADFFGLKKDKTEKRKSGPPGFSVSTTQSKEEIVDEADETFETMNKKEQGEHYLHILRESTQNKNALILNRRAQTMADVISTKTKEILKSDVIQQATDFNKIIDIAGDLIKESPELSLSLLTQLCRLPNADKLFKQYPEIKNKIREIAKEDLKQIAPHLGNQWIIEFKGTILDKVLKKSEDMIDITLEAMRELWSYQLSQITPQELENHIIHTGKPSFPEKCPYLDQLNKNFNTLFDSITLTILNTTDLRARTKIIEYYLNLATKAHENKDLMTAAAINAVFESALILRLKKTFERLSEKSKKQLDALHTLNSKYQSDPSLMLSDKKPLSILMLPYILIKLTPKLAQLEQNKDDLNLISQITPEKEILSVPLAKALSSYLEKIGETVKQKISCPIWITRTIPWTIPSDEELIKVDGMIEKISNEVDRFETALNVRVKQLEPK